MWAMWAHVRDFSGQAGRLRMFALNGDRLEERFDAASNQPWKDYFFIHPARAARLPDGVFKARMAA